MTEPVQETETAQAKATATATKAAAKTTKVAAAAAAASVSADSDAGPDISPGPWPRLRVCVNFRAGEILPSCGARDSRRLPELLRRELADAGVEMRIEPVHCLGRCHLGPALKLLPRGPFLLGVTPDDAGKLARLLHEGGQSGDYAALLAAFPDPDATPPGTEPGHGPDAPGSASQGRGNANPA